MRELTSQTDPAVSLRSVAPSDINDFADGPCRALTATGAGLISVLAADDTTPQTLYLGQGAVLSIAARRVYATGTAATGIVALY